MARKRVTASPSPTRHVVLRHNWRPAGEAGWDDVPGMLPVAYHDSAADAEADRAAREARARRVLNPFSCIRIGLATSLPEEVFCDLAADLGLAAPLRPRKAGRDWEGWWPSVPPEKRPPLWEALDRLRFYTVAPRPRVPLGYATLSLHWGEDFEDRPYLNEEGGIIDTIHRTRRAADEDADRRIGWRSHGHHGYWLPYWVDPLDPESVWRYFATGAAGCDTVEIELHGLPPSRKTAHVVARRTWNTCTTHPNTHERIPVAAFADPAAADALRRELEAEARRQFDVWPLFEDHWTEDQSDAFAAAARRLGLMSKTADPSSWWERQRPVLTPDQRLALWDVVAAVPVEEDGYETAPWVYTVVEAPLEE